MDHCKCYCTTGAQPGHIVYVGHSEHMHAYLLKLFVCHQHQLVHSQDLQREKCIYILFHALWGSSERRCAHLQKLCIEISGNGLHQVDGSLGRVGGGPYLTEVGVHGCHG